MTSWMPLESNPDVMNKFLGRLGVPEKWQVVDVFGLEPDLLQMIPRPVVALILLFPCSETYEKLKAEQETELTEKGQTISDEVYFLKQVISNACGTIALIHSVANNQEEIQLGDGPLKQFLEDTKSMTPDERGAMLMKNEGIASDHNEIAVEGQTQAPPENEPVNHHFVAFVQKEGSLYELDGRKAFPINHGSSNPDTFVEDAAKVLQEIIKKDPNEVRFTVCALTAGSA